MTLEDLNSSLQGQNLTTRIVEAVGCVNKHNDAYLEF